MRKGTEIGNKRSGIEHEKKMFELDHKLEKEQKKHDLLMKEVSKLSVQNLDLERGLVGLKNENLDLLEYLNKIMQSKLLLNS